MRGKAAGTTGGGGKQELKIETAWGVVLKSVNLSPVFVY